MFATSSRIQYLVRTGRSFADESDTASGRQSQPRPVASAKSASCEAGLWERVEARASGRQNGAPALPVPPGSVTVMLMVPAECAGMALRVRARQRPGERSGAVAYGTWR
jgi:hypothetical protein